MMSPAATLSTSGSSSPFLVNRLVDTPASPDGSLAGVATNFHDIVTLMRTVEFASRKHENQRRKNHQQSPYINHPIAVANILVQHGVDHLPTIQAALLHDTIEDTDTTVEELRVEFGEEVARIVQECTDPPNLSAPARKSLQTKTAGTKSREAQQVKLGDKYHNLMSIRTDPPVGWGAERCQKYFAWAKTVTDQCLPSLPAMAGPLDELYSSCHFTLGGKVYPCHPTAGTQKICEDERKWLAEQRAREAKPKCGIFF